MSLYPEFDQLDLSDLVARFEGGMPDAEGDGALYLDELARSIGAKGADGVDYLWRARLSADASRRRAIIAALGSSGASAPGELRAWLHESLRADEPLVVAEAVDAFTQLGDAAVVDAIEPLEEAASEFVRGAVLRYLRKVHPERALPILVAALADSHFIVRESAADELGELGDPSAISALERLRADPHEHVRQAVETALEMLRRG